MKIDLCKIFGVEEGEEFRIRGVGFSGAELYKIQDNELVYVVDHMVKKAYLLLNEVNDITNIIKLPKKKEFTDDELAIMRSLPKLYEWIARDGSGRMFMYNVKPKKSDSYWEAQNTLWNSVVMFEHIFNSITWEDEEPIFIDDYVNRN